jgi:hypothetical protein
MAELGVVSKLVFTGTQKSMLGVIVVLKMLLMW